VPLDAPSDEALKRSFRTYCRLPIGQGRQVGGSVQQINAAQFNQLCRDAGLVEPIGERGGIVCVGGGGEAEAGGKGEGGARESGACGGSVGRQTGFKWKLTLWEWAELQLRLQGHVRVWKAHTHKSCSHQH
jgi:hypothetical protein